jgi:prepilin-type N-terminal cleavage/methylation domain-containing protein
MKHKSKSGFTLVELLVVIAIIAVLLAVLMPAITTAKALAKRVQCKSRLGGIGKAVNIYADQYEGRMPYPAGDPTSGVSGIKTPYEIRQDPDQNAATNNSFWMNLGCLYGAQLIATGKQLYCPANAKGLEEYNRYCLGPDGVTTIQWGSIPNLPTNPSTWWHVSTTYGYAFWPQAKKMLTQADYDIMSSWSGFNPSARYQVGLPATPGKFSDMNPNKSLAADYSPHSVKGSGYNVQVTFGDSHVNMQTVPKDPSTGKLWYCYQSEIPEGELAANWVEILPTVKYFFALQP